MTDSIKIALPKFLQLLNLPIPKAVVVAGKIYKQCNTKAQLNALTDSKLKALGVDDKNDRKTILAAVFSKPNQSMSAVETATIPNAKKRKRQQAPTHEFLPDGPKDEAASLGNLEFNEILDEDILKHKLVVINRAPLLTAWSFVVAEKLGFKREEALSIASVYTEMNAISKGVSLGIYDKGKARAQDALGNSGSQPYVDLMGRRVPLYQSQTRQWRAISSGSPAVPSTSFGYISRSFRQTTPYIVGALRLLADSYSPKELNNKAWPLYVSFRPTIEGWGERSEVRCENILSLRRAGSSASTSGSIEDVVQYDEVPEPDPKKPKLQDEFDDEFGDELDDLDLSGIP